MHKEAAERVKRMKAVTMVKVAVKVENLEKETAEEKSHNSLKEWCHWPESNRHDSCPSRDFKSTVSHFEATRPCC